MTPEEFLAVQASLGEMAEALSAIFQVVRTVRVGFVEQSGLSEEAADLLTIEWCKHFLFASISAQVPSSNRREGGSGVEDS